LTIKNVKGGWGGREKAEHFERWANEPGWLYGLPISEIKNAKKRRPVADLLGFAKGAGPLHK